MDPFKPNLATKAELLSSLRNYIYHVLEIDYAIEKASLSKLDKEAITTLLIDVYTKELRKKPCSLFINYLLKDIGFKS